MGDILGGIFGGGEQTNQTTRPTAAARASNRIRLRELQRMFGSGENSLSDFADPNERDFSVSNRTNRIINRATNPSNLMSLDEYMAAGLDEGSNYINRVARPEIMSTLALQGMERSGAAPEAIGRATAGIAMPFLQSIPGFMAGSAQQATAMANLSDMPRALRAEDYMRRQGVVGTAFTGIPWSPGQRTEGGTSSMPLFNMFGMGGSL